MEKISVTINSSALLPVAVMALLLAALGPVPAGAAAEPDPLDRYNVIWDKPAANAGEDASMPIGNGDIGMNVSVEANGDVVLLLSKTDAWSENQELLKLGQTPSLPDARPHSDRLRCGGRGSKFLQLLTKRSWTSAADS